MILLLTFEGQKLKATMNGVTTEHKASFLKKLSFNDAIEYLKSENKKQSKKQKEITADLDKYNTIYGDNPPNENEDHSGF